MAYCAGCGVTFADSKKNCPLCGSPSGIERPLAADSNGLDFPGDRPFFAEMLEKESLTREQKRFIYFEVVSIVFGSGLFITLLSDVLINLGLTWSRYSSPAIVWGFLLAGMPILLKRHPWILFSILAPTLPLTLFLLDAMNGRLEWFLPWAMPISLWFVACAAGSIGIVAAIRKRGLNVIAVALLFIALYCLGLEAVINLNTGSRPLFVWSVIVALASIPAAGMLFYLHYRIVRQASLKKLFRL